MKNKPDRLELWGGHECTVNRVGDQFYDQSILSGHQNRPGDLEMFAELGVTTLRYPVLWERIEPKPGERDWRWSDKRLATVRDLGLKVCAGLVHHGSGPRHTSLIDESFAPGLAMHAAAVAERYPWIEDWTPVNEPLTTARFSCLYGHWYPHLRNEKAFWLALLNQIDATRLAMKAVRQRIPHARLVQTEDLGQTYSTVPMTEQAAFDNQRRWLTWDFLTGRVTRDHPLWLRLVGFGLRHRIEAIAADPCAPGLIGVNHYLTSDRFLDHDLERYPSDRIGANGKMAYADVEAIRVLMPGPLGLENLLEQTWERYGLPLAVTESHAAGGREDQLRWVREGWLSAQRLRERGVPVEAFTAWSLLGSSDWDSLVTRPAGHYENGVFDLRNGTPRPTAMCALLKALAALETPDIPALAGDGWWRRDIRLQFAPVVQARQHPFVRTRFELDRRAARPLLIVGGESLLGQELARACEWRGLAYLMAEQSDLGRDMNSVAAALRADRPWAVVDASASADIEGAEADGGQSLAAETLTAATLARACGEAEVQFLAFSSDQVFDGRSPRPYVEGEEPNPQNAFGRGKRDAEIAIGRENARSLIIRTGPLFSPFDSDNFAARVVRELCAGRTVRAASDCMMSPTYAPDLIHAVLNLLIDGERGIWHLANPGALTPAAFAARIADARNLRTGLVVASPAAKLGWKARRPAQAALSSERGIFLSPIDDALARFLDVGQMDGTLAASTPAQGGGEEWRSETATARSDR